MRTNKLPPLTEAQIQKQIVQFLAQTGWVPIETSQRGHDWGTPGSPDIIAQKKGRTLNIEVKGPKGKQSEAQELMEFQLERAGCNYFLVRSLDEVMAIVKRSV